MLPRLLPLLCLVCLIQTGVAQQSENIKADKGTQKCPVTKPYQTSLFVPPFPYPRKADKGSFWFGTDRLWTKLPADGRWRGLPYDRAAHPPTFGQKLFWWRQGYDAKVEPQPKLTVSGKRLDSAAPPLGVDRATNALLTDGDAMLVGVNFPTVGCWEITGRYEDDELTFVVWVAK